MTIFEEPDENISLTEEVNKVTRIEEVIEVTKRSRYKYYDQLKEMQLKYSGMAIRKKTDKNQ